jgi:acetyl-CoA C-acetyltransferase
MSEDVFICEGKRTPFGRFGGRLKDFDCYELSAIPIREVARVLRERDGRVDEVYWGFGDTAICKDVFTPCVGRQALLKAGLPPETPSCSFDKACVSGMSAIYFGWRLIKAGYISNIIGGGVAIQSQIPLLLRDQRWKGSGLGSVVLEDPMSFGGPRDFPKKLSVIAGESALSKGITREEQDLWAFESHRKYGEAFLAGKFKEEIIPIKFIEKGGTETWWDIDEQYRKDANLEKMAKLPTIYGSPTVTAGNAPGLNDGAAAILIVSESKVNELKIEPLARIVTVVSLAFDPGILAETPAYAIQKALSNVNMKIDDMKLIEINEAFACVPLVSAKILAEGDEEKYRDILKRLNVNGGAVAIGHPNPASGARIIMTLAYDLRRRGGGYGVAGICGALGQGDAIIIEV